MSAAWPVHLGQARTELSERLHQGVDVAKARKLFRHATGPWHDATIWYVGCGYFVWKASERGECHARSLSEGTRLELSYQGISAIRGSLSEVHGSTHALVGTREAVNGCDPQNSLNGATPGVPTVAKW